MTLETIKHALWHSTGVIPDGIGFHLVEEKPAVEV
tara:strand:- start:251 stop:355 length:105 start_codon:yes stop_codon:yes gene_type:complete